jgi:hypothetical protein
MSSAIPKILRKKEEIDSRDSRDDDRKQTNKKTPNSLAGIPKRNWIFK